MGVECLEAIAWEGGQGLASSFALVEEAKKKEDDGEYDGYVEIVVPRITVSFGVIRGCRRCGRRRGRRGRC